MYLDGKIYMGLAGEERVYMNLPMCNRHGLIAGASGTGKTVTMKCMAESFADAGVPVFFCDVKGDVSGIVQAGDQNEGMEKRIDKFGIRDSFQYKPYSATFWDIYGENGHPVRATITDMGPELLSRILGLTAAQEGVLNILFKIADDRGLNLVDIKDLKAMIAYVGEHKEDYILTYGNIAQQSLGGILRALLPLETQGGDLFFGEPDLDIMDWIRWDINGNGMINLLDCTRLINSPKLYSTFLLWMMAELFEKLPEAGDLDKPRLVFFFDEAHLLFADAPSVLVQKIEQVVKLIRSKGVGIYFVTQSPGDIPNSVLAQCSNRVQHALRAYTPAEQKVVKATAQAFRENPEFKAEDVITELGVGEALVSFLDEEGIPQMVQRTKIICPQSRMAPADPQIRSAAFAADGMTKYDVMVDSVSAYELIRDQKAKDEEAARLAAEREAFEKEKAEFEKQKQKEAEKAAKEAEKAAEKAAREAEKKREREEAAERRRQEQLRNKLQTKAINEGAKLARGLLKNLLKG